MKAIYPSFASFLAVLTLLLISAQPSGAFTFLKSNDPGGPAFQWVDTGPGSTVVLASGNNVAATFTLDRPWMFYGAAFTQLRVSDNGFITTSLTDPGDDFSNDCPIPANPSSGGGRRLYVLHDNLEVLDANIADILYEYFPFSPHPANSCGVHVITWKNVNHIGISGIPFSFQALLFDNGDILYQYSEGNPEAGSGSSTGIQRTGAVGINVVCDIFKSIPENSAILFEPDTIEVTTAVDEFNGTGNVSLREAVNDVDDGGKIIFAAALAGKNIDLSTIGTSLVLSDRLFTIDASDLDRRPSVSFPGAGGNTPIFLLDTQAHLSISGIDLVDAPYGFSNDASTLIACDVEFRDIDRPAAPGSAAYLSNAAEAWFAGCRFLRCSASSGGAVYAQNSSSAEFYRCLFRDNETTGSSGAAEATGGSGLGHVASLIVRLPPLDLQFGQQHIAGNRLEPAVEPRPRLVVCQVVVRPDERALGHFVHLVSVRAIGGDERPKSSLEFGDDRPVAVRVARPCLPDMVLEVHCVPSM